MTDQEIIQHLAALHDEMRRQEIIWEQERAQNLAYTSSQYRLTAAAYTQALRTHAPRLIALAKRYLDTLPIE